MGLTSCGRFLPVVRKYDVAPGERLQCSYLGAAHPARHLGDGADTEEHQGSQQVPQGGIRLVQWWIIKDTFLINIFPI